MCRRQFVYPRCDERLKGSKTTKISRGYVEIRPALQSVSQIVCVSSIDIVEVAIVARIYGTAFMTNSPGRQGADRDERGAWIARLTFRKLRHAILDVWVHRPLELVVRKGMDC